MEIKTADAINDFLTELKKDFPFVNVRISEVPYDDTIMLYHDYKDEDNDIRFLDVLLSLEQKYFTRDGIEDVGVSYDCYINEEAYQVDVDILPESQINMKPALISTRKKIPVIA